MLGRNIVIEGKHGEKEYGHSLISRHFVRKYVLPEGYKPEEVISSQSLDGVLSVMAPRQKPTAEEGERIVPIERTGPAHKNIKKATNEDAQKLE